MERIADGEMNDHLAYHVDRTSEVPTGVLVLGVLFYVGVGCSTRSIRPFLTTQPILKVGNTEVSPTCVKVSVP